MKATIDLPDTLYRRVKAKSANEGRTIRAVAIDLFRGWLGDPTEEGAALRERLARYRGSVASGKANLATNPRHLEGFGRDDRRDR